MAEFSPKLTKQITLALVLGLVLGLGLHYTNNGEWAQLLSPIGTVFISLLKMIIVPLVFSSIYMALLNLGTPKELGSLGWRAIVYYMSTTALAVLVGLILVNLIQPGVGHTLATSELPAEIIKKVSGEESTGQTVLSIILGALPTNPFASFAEGNVLQIIVLAMLFGLSSLFIREEARAFSQFVASVEKITLSLTHFIMVLAPYGIFVLMLNVIARSGLETIKTLAMYMVTVVIGLFIHAVVLTAIGSVLGRRSPLTILRFLVPVLVTAFSTASSAATLPITLATLQEKLKLDPKVTDFVVPLGATINMDGTALYESVAAIFIAQAYGIDLSFSAQIIIFFTASLAAIGAAAIPGAGLVTMGIVLKAVGLPFEGISLILAVDRILDMFRTSVNVYGDCIGTIVVERSYLNKKKA